MEMPDTSLTLLARLRSTRDDGAWRDFVALYGPLVYRLSRRRGLDSDAADNIVQTFCIKMLKELPELEYDPARGRFRKWVLTVALNEIRMERRRVAREMQHFEALAEHVRGDGAEIDPDLEAWWNEAERAQAVRVALERLRDESSPVHFGVFRMAVIDRKPAEQVAAAFHIKPQYVYGIASRLRQRLRAIASEVRTSWKRR